jgi:hypothetical protein
VTLPNRREARSARCADPARPPRTARRDRSGWTSTCKERERRGTNPRTTPPRDSLPGRPRIASFDRRTRRPSSRRLALSPQRATGSNGRWGSRSHARPAGEISSRRGDEQLFRTGRTCFSAPRSEFRRGRLGAIEHLEVGFAWRIAARRLRRNVTWPRNRPGCAAHVSDRAICPWTRQSRASAC